MIFKDIKILNKNFEVEDHQNVVVIGEYITYAGPEAQNETGHEVIDGHNKFLMPAFYNTHCHIAMTLLRGFGEGLPLDRWLNEKVWPFEAKYTANDKYWAAALGACELIKSGCVSVTENYFDLPTIAGALHNAGLKANICNPYLVFEEKSFYDDNSYRDTVNLMNWIKEHDDGRIKADASIHSEYCSTLNGAKEVAEFAKEYDLIIQAHVSETQKEQAECIERNGMTPVQYMYAAGALDQPFIAAHCVWLTEEDMEIMKNSGAYVSHNPRSNLKLGSGIAPIKTYYEKGMNITFGTDGASSNNNLDMLEEIQYGAMLCRGVTHDANAIPASEILRMATQEGAYSQGRFDCGTLEEGKRADLIMFDLDRPNLQPDYDTVSNIVFAAHSSDIVMTMRDGDVIYRNGELVHIDEEKVKAEAVESFNRILNSL